MSSLQFSIQIQRRNHPDGSGGGFKGRKREREANAFQESRGEANSGAQVECPRCAQSCYSEVGIRPH